MPPFYFFRHNWLLSCILKHYQHWPILILKQKHHYLDILGFWFPDYLDELNPITKLIDINWYHFHIYLQISNLNCVSIEIVCWNFVKNLFKSSRNDTSIFCISLSHHCVSLACASLSITEDCSIETTQNTL